MPGFPDHHQLPELTQDYQVADTIQPSHPLSSPLLLPLIFPSIRVFSNESVKGDSLKNTLMLGKIEGRKRREAEKEMVRWHH